MNNTETVKTIAVHDVKVGDVVGDFGWLPVTDIMITGPSVYEVRLHGPAEYWITVGAEGVASQTFEVKSDAMLTIAV